MRVAVASDHAGFELKQLLADHVKAAGFDVVDLGTTDTASVDWPDYGAAIGRAVASGEVERGIAVCGSGIGICIAANKIAGVRAATVHDVTSARMTRQHNDANVMCLGERFVGIQVAIDAVNTFLSTDFEGGRHQRRIDKVTALESTPEHTASPNN